jgi:hypothetical protein
VALATLFQDFLLAQAALDAAHADVAAKQQARDAARAAALAVLPSLRKYVVATYGEESTAFTTFGFTPTKAPQKSTQVKAAAAAKAAATRKAHEAALKAPVPPVALPASPAVTAAPQNVPTAPVPAATVKS